MGHNSTRNNSRILGQKSDIRNKLTSLFFSGVFSPHNFEATEHYTCFATLHRAYEKNVWSTRPPITNRDERSKLSQHVDWCLFDSHLDNHSRRPAGKLRRNCRTLNPCNSESAGDRSSCLSYHRPYLF